MHRHSLTSLVLACSMALAVVTTAHAEDLTKEDAAIIELYRGWTDPSDPEFLQLALDQAYEGHADALDDLADALIDWDLLGEITDLQVSGALGILDALGGTVVEFEDLGGTLDTVDFADPIGKDGKGSDYACDDLFCASTPTKDSLVGGDWYWTTTEGGSAASRVEHGDDGSTTTYTNKFDKHGIIEMSATVNLQEDGSGSARVTTYVNGQGHTRAAVWDENGNPVDLRQGSDAAGAGPMSLDLPDTSPEAPDVEEPDQYQPADGTEGSYCPLYLPACQLMVAEAEAQLKDPYRIIEGMIKVLPARDDDEVEATTLIIVRDALVSDPDAIRKTSTKVGERTFPISLPVLVLPPRPAN